MTTASTAMRISDATTADQLSADAASFSRWGWYPPKRCLSLFDDVEHPRRALERWRAALPAEQVDAWRTPIHVRGDAVLPDGQRLAEALQRNPSVPIASVPQEVQQGTDKQRKAEKLRIELLIRDKNFQEANPNLPPTSADYFTAFKAAHGRWAGEQRLGCGRSVIMDLRKRAAMGEPLWAAYKCGRKRDGELFDKEIFDECVSLDLHPHKFTIVGGYSIYEYGRARAWKEGKVWDGSEATFARRLKEATPNPIRRAGREGMWAAEAYCIPKVERGLREQFRPGDAVSLDGRKADQFVRVPKSGGGWRIIRPLDVVFFDCGSNRLVALHSEEHESAAATNALLYQLAESDYGVVGRIETDNGGGFVRSLISKQAWSKDKQIWLETAAKLLGIEVYRAPARHAWHKLAESRFAAFKETDRQAPFFVGGSPSERPDDVARRARHHIHEIPTFEEYRAQRVKDVALYNQTPQTALDGMTPNQVYELNRGQVPIRRVDKEVLDFVCAQPVGTREVTRDGVQYRNIKYGAHDEDVWRLQGQTVVLRAGPDASFVWLCDNQGKPLAIATKGALSGATSEDLKRAEHHKARLRKITREYLKGHDFMNGTKVLQVREVMREHRAAQEAEWRESLQESNKPAVTIAAAADLDEPVKRLNKKRRKRETKRILQATAANTRGDEDVSKSEFNPFDLLYESLRKPETDCEEHRCQADLLRDFGSAG